MMVPLGGSLHVTDENLSIAWMEAFEQLMRPGVDALEPLTITVTGFDREGHPNVIPEIAELVDRELMVAHRARHANASVAPKHGPMTVATAASTIFPASLWNPSRPRQELYSKYLSMLPRLRKDSRNRRGIYFHRLIQYGRGPEDGNQLEHMFRAFSRGVKRTSAYQATITDPATDMTKTPLLGFPCLQQIAVHPSERRGTLSITGFYGTQYLFTRGYGNLLGLVGLGRFLAHEMGLRLVRMTCIASYAPAEDISRTAGRRLIADAQRVIRGRAQ